MKKKSPADQKDETTSKKKHQQKKEKSNDMDDESRNKGKGSFSRKRLWILKIKSWKAYKVIRIAIAFKFFPAS